MDPGYLIVGCLFVGLAIAVRLWRLRRDSEKGPTWLTRDLLRGDLRALSHLRKGENEEVFTGQIGRLRSRGFLTEGLLGGYRITMKGRSALMLRALIGSYSETPPSERIRGDRGKTNGMK